MCIMMQRQYVLYYQACWPKYNPLSCPSYPYRIEKATAVTFHFFCFHMDYLAHSLLFAAYYIYRGCMLSTELYLYICFNWLLKLNQVMPSTFNKTSKCLLVPRESEGGELLSSTVIPSNVLNYLEITSQNYHVLSEHCHPMTLELFWEKGWCIPGRNWKKGLTKTSI